MNDQNLDSQHVQMHQYQHNMQAQVPQNHFQRFNNQPINNIQTNTLYSGPKQHIDHSNPIPIRRTSINPNRTSSFANPINSFQSYYSDSPNLNYCSPKSEEFSKRYQASLIPKTSSGETIAFKNSNMPNDSEYSHSMPANTHYDDLLSEGITDTQSIAMMSRTVYDKGVYFNTENRFYSNAGMNGVPLLMDEKMKKRRESHNAVERRRRDVINEKIHELNLLVPDPIAEGEVASKQPKSSTNKGTILKKSVDYIRYLQDKINKLEQRNNLLERVSSTSQNHNNNEDCNNYQGFAQYRDQYHSNVQNQ